MTHKPTDVGLRNRTGIQASPLDGRAMVKGAEEATLDGQPDTGAWARMRIDLSQSVEPLGTMPIPMTVTGTLEAMAETLQGNRMPLFLDLLGERIAYERTGIRLYEALLCKHAAAHLHAPAPRAEDLAAIRADELQHLGLVVRTMERLGGDATALTPAADAQAVSARGWLATLADPRTTFSQALRTVLQAELGDHEGWELLASVAQAMGFHDLATSFRNAQLHEAEHVRKVKGWLQESLRGQAT